VGACFCFLGAMEGGSGAWGPAGGGTVRPAHRRGVQVPQKPHTAHHYDRRFHLRESHRGLQADGAGSQLGLGLNRPKPPPSALHTRVPVRHQRNHHTKLLWAPQGRRGTGGDTEGACRVLRGGRQASPSRPANGRAPATQEPHWTHQLDALNQSWGARGWRGTGGDTEGVGKLRSPVGPTFAPPTLTGAPPPHNSHTGRTNLTP
jgi:hypothetical protein